METLYVLKWCWYWTDGESHLASQGAEEKCNDIETLYKFLYQLFQKGPPSSEMTMNYWITKRTEEKLKDES